MKTSMLALALALVAPAAFSQTSLPVTHPRTHAKAKAPALDASAAGQIKTLRQEIKRERAELAAKHKALKAEHQALVGQETAELAKVKAAPGKKSERKQARLAVRQKYAAMFKDIREKRQSESRMLREDINSKRGVISKLRQS